MNRRRFASSFRIEKLAGVALPPSLLASSSVENNSAAPPHSAAASAMAAITTPRSCTNPDISKSASTSTPAEATDPAVPVIDPRRDLPTVLPRISLYDTEQAARLTASPASAAQIASPAADPSNVSAASTISAAKMPCPADPATHAHLRRAIACTQPAITICGNSAPASRIGTSAPA